MDADNMHHLAAKQVWIELLDDDIELFTTDYV